MWFIPRFDLIVSSAGILLDRVENLVDLIRNLCFYFLEKIRWVEVSPISSSLHWGIRDSKYVLGKPTENMEHPVFVCHRNHLLLCSNVWERNLWLCLPRAGIVRLIEWCILWHHPKHFASMIVSKNHFHDDNALVETKTAKHDICNKPYVQP